MTLIFAFPGYEKLAASIALKTGFSQGDVTVRHFPDGESFVQLQSDVSGKRVIVVCGLDRPDEKVMALVFFANVAKELGAKEVGLVTPYLGYMRQDKRFHEGEAISSRIFAKLLSNHVDWLITIDPHLHRYHSLDEIYSIPSQVLHVTDTIAVWIKDNVPKPVLIGPDSESGQWVSDVAQKAGAPYVVSTKIRRGDRNVEVSIPDVKKYKDYTPVLVDDIISTGRTMMEAVKHIHSMNMKKPICIGIHAVFADAAYENLKNADVEDIITCNTITHPSNKIFVDQLLANAFS